MTPEYLNDLSVTYVPLARLTDIQNNIFNEFREWRDDVDRQLIEFGMEEAEFGPLSPAMGLYVRTVGYNSTLEECPEILLDLIDKMPEIPTDLPQTWYGRDTYVRDIELIVGLKPWVFPQERLMELASDLAESANKLTALAKEIEDDTTMADIQSASS